MSHTNLKTPDNKCMDKISHNELKSMINPMCEKFVLIREHCLDETNELDGWDTSDESCDNKNIINSNNFSDIVSFEVSNFINLILESYHDEESIIRQFFDDYKRFNITINGNTYTTFSDFVSAILPFNSDIKIDNLKNVEKAGSTGTSKDEGKISMIMLILLLSCQSSMFISFEYIHNKLTKMKNESAKMGKISRSVKMKKRMSGSKYHVKRDPNIYEIMLADTRERKDIIFECQKNYLRCIYKSKYKIISTSSGEPLMYIEVEMSFDINSKTGLIIYNAIKV